MTKRKINNQNTLQEATIQAIKGDLKSNIINDNEKSKIYNRNQLQDYTIYALQNNIN